MVVMVIFMPVILIITAVTGVHALGISAHHIPVHPRGIAKPVEFPGIVRHPIGDQLPLVVISIVYLIEHDAFVLNNRRAGQPRRIERIGNLKHARLSEDLAAFELIPDFAILVIDRNFQRQAALCYLNLRHPPIRIVTVFDGAVSLRRIFRLDPFDLLIRRRRGSYETLLVEFRRGGSSAGRGDRHGGFAVPHVADGDFAEIAQREFVQIGGNGIGARKQVDIVLRSPGKGRFG